MHSAAPALIASCCPDYAEVEIYNEKESLIPMDRHWDIVFFSYLHSFYEHTKVLSTIFRRAGMITVAGGRHASLFVEDCQKYFDAVVVGEPEINVPKLIEDFEKKRLQKVYRYPSVGGGDFRPYRYDLTDFKKSPVGGAPIEASRGCPFACTFCVLTGNEKYRYRPVKDVINDITTRMRWNHQLLGLLKDVVVFLDNNLGGSPQYLRELCEALIPLKKRWGCSLTFNVLEDEALVKLMSKAGCRYIYTGLESLNPDSLKSINKKQNRLKQLNEIVKRTFSNGIILSFGIILGTDGDTNEYLEKLPSYLSDFGYLSLTFLGIVCPYPGTSFYHTLVNERRLLPGATIRDFDGYSICHRPKFLDPTEVVEHYKNICTSLVRMTNIVKYLWSKIWLSNLPGYKLGLLLSCPEIRSIKHSLINKERTFIAGHDPIEEWDAKKMEELGISPQIIS